MRPQKPAQGQPARPRFLAEPQARSRMNRPEFFDELEHVVMFPTDDPIPPHFACLTGRNRHGDGIVIHVRADE